MPSSKNKSDGDTDAEYVDAPDSPGPQFHLAKESFTPVTARTNASQSQVPLLATTPADTAAAAAQQLLGGVSVDDPGTARTELKVYPMRYYVLLVVVLLNLSNTMLWISLAPVANYADRYYELAGAANMLSSVFLLSTIFIGVFAIFLANRFGLRVSILIAATFNGIGASIRLVSCFLPDPFTRFVVALVGQGIAACAYPFIMFLPPKVASCWFAESELSLATMLAVLANPLGVMLPNLVVPQLVDSTEDVPLVTILAVVPCVVSCLMAVLGVRSSSPPTPPTHSSSVPSMDFCLGLRKLARSRAFLTLCLSLGGGLGMFNTFYTVIQQLLCPYGYSNQFSGLCPVAMIVCGFIGGIFSAKIADATKRYEELFKLCFSMSCVSGILLMQLAMHPNLHVWIVLTCAVFGVFGLSTYGLGLNLGAECSHPVDATTSTGIVVLVGQFQSVLYITLMNWLRQPIPDHLIDTQTCEVAVADTGTMASVVVSTLGPVAIDVPPAGYVLTLPSLVLSGIAAFLAIFALVFFRPKYRRQMVEQQQKQLQMEIIEAVTNEEDDPRLAGLKATNGLNAAEKGEFVDVGLHVKINA